MNRKTKKEVEKAMGFEVEEIQHLVPEIVQPFVPANRQDYINKMADKVLAGEMTYYDIGRDLQLTDNQIRYCIEYTTGEHKANGTMSAVLAYGYDPEDKMKRQQAANWASKYNVPTHPCSTLIQIINSGQGFNAHQVDMNLMFIASQTNDMKSAVLANREINTILGRNNKKVVEVQVTHKLDYSSLAKKDLQKLIEIARKARIKDDNSDE